MSCHAGKTLLAEGPFCKVEGCACGTMHVSIGPLTIRLRPDGVESVWSTLGEALGFIARADERAAQARERKHLS